MEAVIHKTTKVRRSKMNTWERNSNEAKLGYEIETLAASFRSSYPEMSEGEILHRVCNAWMVEKDDYVQRRFYAGRPAWRGTVRELVSQVFQG